MIGHDQKPSSWTTGAQSPFGPAACGIAWPSGVWAALMIASALELLPAPEVPPVFDGGGLGGGGGRLCLTVASIVSTLSPLPSMPPQLTTASKSAPVTPSAVHVHPDL